MKSIDLVGEPADGVWATKVKGARILTPMEWAVHSSSITISGISLTWTYCVLLYVLCYRFWVVDTDTTSLSSGELVAGAITGIFPMFNNVLMEMYMTNLLQHTDTIQYTKQCVFGWFSALYLIYLCIMYFMLGYWVIYMTFVVEHKSLKWDELFYRMVTFNCMTLTSVVCYAPSLCFTAPKYELKPKDEKQETKATEKKEITP